MVIAEVMHGDDGELCFAACHHCGASVESVLYIVEQCKPILVCGIGCLQLYVVRDDVHAVFT